MAVHGFFIGKGGVGKSTTSALTALALARAGRSVLLVSLDPAHNLADIFDASLGRKPKTVRPGLLVAQGDQKYWTDQYLKGVEDQIKRTYTYQAAFNLQGHLRILRHSPGIEEYAMALAFNHYRQQHAQADHVLFDMPPTALTMKFFSLPALSLTWLEHLTTLRDEIVRKKAMITRIKVGKADVERDKISNKLREQADFYTAMRDLFQDSAACRVCLVLNPEKLSRAEGGRIRDAMDDLGMAPASVVVNKCLPGDDPGMADMADLFPGVPTRGMPVACRPLTSLDALDEFLDADPSLAAFLAD